MTEQTIAARGVRALLNLAVSRGANPTALARRAGIDSTDLSDPETRVPFAKYVALMRAGQELCSDPALGLHFGETVDAAEISIGCAVGGVDTIDDAFAQVNRYARLAVEVDGMDNGDRFRLVRGGGQLWVVDTRRNPNDFPELTESTFARMVCSTRRSLGDVRIFKAAHFTHAEPTYRAEYERIFRSPVVFGSDRNALQIDAAILPSLRIPATSAHVSTVLRAHAESLLAKLDRSRSTRARVEQVLTPILATGTVSVAAVARALGLSRQTLFRRLRAENVTFEQVLAELRHKLAVHYLSANRATVNQTASLVGYSDPAAFSRAFKRWTGTSPSGMLPRN